MNERRYPLSIEALAERVEGLHRLVIERIESGFRNLQERFDFQRIMGTEFESEIKYEIQSIKTLQREQNGNVTKALNRISKAEEILAKSEADRDDLKGRLSELEKVREYGVVRKALWKDQYTWLLAGMNIAAVVFAVLRHLGVI
jgi:ABC-type phosphate transport system auxiliary subunit